MWVSDAPYRWGEVLNFCSLLFPKRAAFLLAVETKIVSRYLRIHKSKKYRPIDSPGKEGLQRGVGEFKIAEILNLRRGPMKLTINGVEQEESEFDGDTLGAVLSSLVKKTPGSYIRRIWLDDKESPADDQMALQKNPSEIGSLKVELANLKDLVATNLTNALDYLKKLIPGFEQAAGLFRAGNEQEANKYYMQILDGIGWFSQVVNIIMQSDQGELALPGAENENLEVRQTKLTDLMSQMLEANQNQDWVLLADILEYEMVPFYKDWETILSKLNNPH